MLTIKQRVKAILGASRAARNSDTELWLIYAQKSGLELTPRQINVVRAMPSSETLRRTRQIIQNTEGNLRPDQNVERARFNKYVNVKHGIAHEEPETILKDSNGKQYNLPFGW